MPILGPSSSTQSSRLAVRYIDDLIVLSQDKAWTYLHIPNVHYDFLTPSERISLAQRFNLALTALVTGFEPIDAHLIVTHRPYSVDAWQTTLNARAQKSKPERGWFPYLENMADYLESVNFLRSETFLGICLGNRSLGLSGPAGFLANPFATFTKKSEKALGYEDQRISNKEIDKWREKAREVQRSLSDSHIGAQPAHPNQIAWLVSKPLWPGMEAPRATYAPKGKWGPGEVVALGEGLIENGHRMLRIEQVGEDGTIVEGFTSTLVFSRFPDVLVFPQQEPWLMYANALDFPVDISLRFSLVPARKVHQDVKKRLADTKDQYQHIQEAGMAVPLQVQEALDSATILEYKVDKERSSWVYGRYRLRISADDPDTLAGRCRRVIEHYRDLGMDVVWPTGDQFDLLCEAMPGDKARGNAYQQRQESIMIPGGMPNATVEVGNRVDGKGRGWIGPYLGYTTSRQVSPVFLSPHVAIAQNGAPGIAITGAPGGGKSFSAFTIAYQMALQGIWTIYIDPKADAITMTDLPGLENARLFDLRAGHDGMLDPFAMGDDSAQGKLLALETLRLLLAGKISEDREEAITEAVDYVVSQGNPSLTKVVDRLLESPHTHGRNLGGVLRTIRDLPFSRLCFAPNAGEMLRPEDGMTIITLLGLSLPAIGKAMDEYGYEERLAVSVMYLLTRYARRLMLSLDKSHPKAICIDEAWAITSTPQGAQLIPEVARMGRSHNTALVLVTQNAGDLMSEGVTNSISTKLAFRSTNLDEIDNVLHFFGLPVTNEYRDVIRTLTNGECLMQDVDRRVSRVQIDSWDEDAFRAFNTNPETRGKAEASGKNHAATASTNPWDMPS